MTIEAHALEADGSHVHARFSSLHRFERDDADGTDDVIADAKGEVLLDDPLVRVRTSVVDHEMPVLAFALEEKAQVRVAADRIAAMGLTADAWLRTLKDAVLLGAPDDTPIDVAWRDHHGAHLQRRTVGELRPVVLDTVHGRRIGYMTDLRFTEANVDQLMQLLADVDLLHIESVFLHADCDHALRKNHLTARQAGEIERRLRARHVVPFHFSPRYRGREVELRAELFAAWSTESQGHAE